MQFTLDQLGPAVEMGFYCIELNWAIIDLAFGLIVVHLIETMFSII